MITISHFNPYGPVSRSLSSLVSKNWTKELRLSIGSISASPGGEIRHLDPQTITTPATNALESFDVLGLLTRAKDEQHEHGLQMQVSSRVQRFYYLVFGPFIKRFRNSLLLLCIFSEIVLAIFAFSELRLPVSIENHIIPPVRNLFFDSHQFQIKPILI